MKCKNSGISLLVALGISFVVLGIAMAIITSISRSLEQSSNLERSNQIFFATESGVEAAFFHHNARGQGVHFVDSDISQEINHPESATNVSWTINGRTEPVIGWLYENGEETIPLYWDNSANPTETPPIDENGNFNSGNVNAGALSSNEAFQLSFYNQVQDNSGNDSQQAVFDSLGEFQLPLGFDFGSDDTEVLIDWSASRKNNDDGWQTFVPSTGSGICQGDSEFICENELPASINSEQNISGDILPGGTPTTLNAFLSDNNSSTFSLSFRPLLPFEDVDLGKIIGIPFSLSTEGTSIPKNTYFVSATVQTGAFTKTISLSVPEKTTLGVFNYVLFD